MHGTHLTKTALVVASGLIMSGSFVVASSAQAAAKKSAKKPASSKKKAAPAKKKAAPAKKKAVAKPAPKKAKPCAKECAEEGRCKVRRKKCVAASTAQCAASSGCTQQGRCSLKSGACVVRSDKDCSASAICKESGHCRAKGGVCIVLKSEDCRASSGCTAKGECHHVLDRCEALVKDDCAASVGCLKEGRCSVRKGRCLVASSADCALSEGCKKDGKCKAIGRTCMANAPEPKSSGKRIGVVVGAGGGLQLFPGSLDDFGYVGAGVQAGFNLAMFGLDKLTVLAGFDFRAAGTFKATTTVNALNKGLSKQQIDVVQGVDTTLSSWFLGANYSVLGDLDSFFSVYGTGRFGMMSYALKLEEIPRKSGYEEVDATPMTMSILQLTLGVGGEIQAGPVRAFVEGGYALALAGGKSTPLDMSSPNAVVVTAGARFAF